MGDTVEASWFAEKIADRSIRGIALETSALIRAGVLPIGTRLPAIRDIAYELHVSPATISEAWSELRRQKIISGRGRNGTWVSGDRFVAKPERLASSGNYAAGVLDLTLAGPDAALLPRLAEAMAYGASVDDLNSYERSRIVPELKDAVSERWPYEAEAFLATNGGYNAVYTILHALVSSGSSVAIEHPTGMRLLDILEDLGVKIIPVACDGEGPLPDSLREALQQRPAAFLFQPRLHSVTGVTVSSSRLDQLGDVLEDSDTLIIEDDGVGDVSAAPPQSLGDRFAERTIHILSLSKSLGPDLRLAVLSSSAPIVDQIQSYRSFSAGWTSRIVQGAAAWLLRDPATLQLIAEAREIYRQRRDALADALSERGIPIPPSQGLCLWVPVVSEPFAMVTLAARNIAVNPGSKFSVLPSSHIRVATSTLSDRCEEAADAIALAHAP
ncbi:MULTISPECIES: PLP-dependent aminotransferase family protein [Rhizobium]|jgi:DNA-binding transcriptional MocR family regulator|uniref:aminotransferase-like domain-containing protein n=1 Tax=Rhizobium TaxID=379 RepID=UPI000FEC6F15|nr:PLP-dependent aminotransferase family protein [Rhizobium leguminosarum]MBY2942720.1 PLP-dependent aminotransferase family protein [Rhizobium leguminosarum]MBY2991861.1 PLP-dependent aminotransferase family protein [Rhizobium leguminosarum]MBY3023644.1 PLP-dependent aminotransferase family protein [Rhizobium leguminosarum]MBY3032093.1 PLP-dependent aminotransferase family protein [Rhizobium leguminosarum]MBY3045597.1 PLP-dependent aminotransferase family protein [Rhizobium leguminosarum]